MKRSRADISIDDQDIRDVTQESLRRSIAMVTQETAMFNRSARDNIVSAAPTRLMRNDRSSQASGSA